MRHLIHAPLALALLAPCLASAQDLEDRTSEIDQEQVKKLETDIFFESQWHEYDNLDWRPLDETSDQAILDSDDRNSFAFTGLSATLGYQIDPRTRLVFGVSHRGLWGNDQLGSTNAFGGWVYISAAYFDYQFRDEGGPSFRVGRQYLSLSGPGREYVLADILDMVRFDWALSGVGTLTLIPIDVSGLAASADDAELYRFISQSPTQTFGFRGDHMTRRHGLLFQVDDLEVPLDATLYAFYSDIGALGSGSDITYNGRLGNFADNDWVANFGLRAAYEIGPITPFAGFDMSQGVDRKELVARDVDCNGIAFSGGVAVKTGDDESGLEAEASIFYAQGASYDEDGMQYSHGFVGMKGKQIGGAIFNRYLGWHPSAYVGMFGISDQPHDINRKAGTQVIHVGAGYDLPGPLSFSAGWWGLADTGVTYLDLDELDTITPPYGYSREEFKAEERMGTSLGHEIDLEVGAELTEHIDLHLTGAVVLPGEYQQTEVNRIAGDMLGGDAMAWVINGGAQVRF